MRRHALFHALLVLNVLLVFGPCLATDPTAAIWAWPRTDYVGEAWLQWEMARQVASFDPGITSSFVDFPDGKLLTEHFQDYGVALLGAPLTWLLGALGGFNLASVFHYLAFGFAFYGLAHELIEDRWGAVAAALLASHSTVLFVMLWWGEAPLQSAWLLPLTWWALVRGARDLDAHPVRVGLVLGVLLGLSGYLASYYLYFSALAVGVWGIWMKPWTRWRAVVVGGATWAVTTAAIYLPRLLLLPTKDSTLGGGAPQTLDVLDWSQPFQLPMRWGWTTSLDAGGLLSPLWSARDFHGEAANAEGAVYLGWVLLVCGVLGLIRKLPHRRLFVALGVLGLVLSLGPYLRYGNNAFQVLVDDSDPMTPITWAVPLPHVLFAKLLPGFERMMHPYRFVLFASFVLSLGAGWLVRGRPAWALGVVVLHAGEHGCATSGLVPFSPTTVELPSTLTTLPATPACPGVAVAPRLRTYKTGEWRHISEVVERPAVVWDDWLQVEVTKDASWKDGLEWDRPSLYLQMTAWERPLADHVPERMEWGDPMGAADLAGGGVGVVVVVEDLEAFYAPMSGGLPPQLRDALAAWPKRAGGVQRALSSGGATLAGEVDGYQVWTLPGCGA